MSLLIKNGEIVTADARYRADIWCERETITRIGTGISAPQGAEVIDATGKLFLAYKGAFGIDDSELYQSLALARRLGVIVTAHCENAEAVWQLQRRLLSEGKTGPEWHEPSRPPAVEAEGLQHLATFAELTG